MKTFKKKRFFLKFLLGSVISLIFFRKIKISDKKTFVLKKDDSVTWVLNKNDI
tara:strand:+ start:1016 stop:1174 length:159 start_codon:yes stop_codon:yes gene_type:complete